MADRKVVCSVIDKVKSADGSEETSLDGKLVYKTAPPAGFVRITYYPAFIDPFYAPILNTDRKNADLIISDDVRSGLSPRHHLARERLTTTINIRDMSFSIFLTPLNTVQDEENMELPYYAIHDNKLHELSENKNFMMDGKPYNNRVISDYKAPMGALKQEKERKIVVIGQADPVLDSLTNYFIGSLEGPESGYIAPYAYDTQRGFTIIGAPLYGHVLLRTAPDSRFYLSYYRNNNGALVGEVIRSRLIPGYEQKQANEMEGCIVDNGVPTPVYFSYYDLLGSGQQLTIAQYKEFLAQKAAIVQEQTNLPKELVGLLGF